MNIREERSEDIAAIRSVNIEAFGRAQEANLIEMLRTNGGILLSLVAPNEDQIVGHLLYSPVTAGSGEKKIAGAGLGPMAVLPEYQRRGIGAKLIDFGTSRQEAKRLSLHRRVGSCRVLPEVRVQTGE